MSQVFKRTKNFTKGFTLVELLVTTSIMVVILSTIVLNQSKYTQASALKNIANDISLSLRQAQIYGTSVKELGAGSNDFSAAYGLSFDLVTPANNNAYIFFADRVPLDSAYNGTWACVTGGTNECIDKTTLTPGHIINSICVMQTNGNEICNGVGGVDVTFLRPSTNAIIKFRNTGGNPYTPVSIAGARIVLLSSGSGVTKSIIVYTTGQISIQ